MDVSYQLDNWHQKESDKKPFDSNLRSSFESFRCMGWLCHLKFSFISSSLGIIMEIQLISCQLFFAWLLFNKQKLGQILKSNRYRGI